MKPAKVSFDVDVDDEAIAVLFEHLPWWCRYMDVEKECGRKLYVVHTRENGAYAFDRDELVEAVSSFLTGEWDECMCCAECVASESLIRDRDGRYYFMPDDACASDIVLQLVVFGDVVYN